MKLILGVDPGISGGAVIISYDRTFIQFMVFKKLTPNEIAKWVKAHSIEFCCIEGVGARPKQGIASTFKFGTNFGWWLGLLAACEISYERVYPLRWQTAMGCRTGGDKRISKHRAQELFPKIKVTHAIADALLIAEYGRRLYIPKAIEL